MYRPCMYWLIKDETRTLLKRNLTSDGAGMTSVDNGELLQSPFTGYSNVPSFNWPMNGGGNLRAYAYG